MREEAKSRHALAQAVITLTNQRLTSGYAGNASVRQGNGLLITPTGATAATISADNIVEIDISGVLKGEGIASSEWAFHSGIMADRPEINAVIHCHSDACTALSCLRRSIPAFHYMIASFGGDNVRCSEYKPFGSDALANAALRAIKGRNACLLANHGMIVAGETLKHAMELAVKLETLARQYILACQAGRPVILTNDDMLEVHKRYGHYGKSAMPR